MLGFEALRYSERGTIDTDLSSRVATDSTQRERTRAMIAGLLGIVMFLAGFMRWLKVGDGDNRAKYSGFAFGMPTTAIIGFSRAAEIMVLLGASERRPGRGVPTAVPTALAATSFVLAVGVYFGEGAISPDLGSKVGVEIGLVVGLIVALIQTIVLGTELASRRDNDGYDTSGRNDTGNRNR